jgi:hypothetical protein
MTLIGILIVNSARTAVLYTLHNNTNNISVVRYKRQIFYLSVHDESCVVFVASLAARRPRKLFGSTANTHNIIMKITGNQIKTKVVVFCTKRISSLYIYFCAINVVY